MRRFTLAATLLFSLCFALSAFAAAPLRVFVSDMNVVGVQNRDELKATLQTLLASRLNGDTITAVASSAEADAILTGTYVVIGKVFSVDAMAKSANGRTLTRAFVQGESQDELIPAMGKLADKLSADLSKLYASGQIASSAPAYAAASSVVRPNRASQGDSVNSALVRPDKSQEIIRPRDLERNYVGGWQSKRLPGAANLLAMGKTLPDGSREIFLAEDRRLSYYHQAENMSLRFATEFGTMDKIIGLDTVQGSDGKTEVYLTIMHGEEPSSQIWVVGDNRMECVAKDLPYYLRVVGLAGGPKKVYAQSAGRETEFYGNVSEVTRKGSKVTLSNEIVMPRFGNIFTFNQFKDQQGVLYTVVLHPDGYLVVFDQEQKELWRSNDKFGGSELYYQKDNSENFRITNDKYRWFFMNQRIQVTSRNEVLVGKNDGFWVLGNARSYKKGAVYCFTWNGSNLDELWHTRDTQNYMPDFYFDEASSELLLLQTVQRPGLTSRGTASLAIKKVE
jgi:hypothetical protein